MRILPESSLALTIAVPLGLAIGAGLVTPAFAQAPIGGSYCPAVRNSSGAAARLVGAGSATLDQNRFLLRASNLPAGSMGVFLTAREAGFVPGIGGGVGNLCLGGAIARLSNPVAATGGGQLEHSVDLPALVVAGMSVLAGDTLRFQLIFRDRRPQGGATTNSSNGLAVTFACGTRMFPEPMVEIPGAWNMASGDFDGDGDLDLVVVRSRSQVKILENVGTAIPREHSSILVRAGAALSHVIVNDLDGDGALDLVIGEQSEARAWFLQGDRQLGFGTPVPIAIPRESNLAGLADLNGDGRMDLITSGSSSSPQQYRITAQIQVGAPPAAAPTFGAATSIIIQRGSNCHSAIEVGDIDSDGRDEIVLSAGNPRLEIIELTAMTTLGLGAPIVTAFPTYQIAMGDLNGDGHLDMVRSSDVQPMSCNTFIQGVYSIDILDGDGSGQFSSRQRFPGRLYRSGWLAVSDLGGDGDLDLLVLGQGGLERFSNDGTGHLTALPVQQTGNPPSGPHLLDVDGDGTQDLAYLRSEPEAVVIAYGLAGDDGFDVSPTLSFGSKPRRMISADFDGDGHTDVAVVTEFSDVHVLRGNGSGELAPHDVISFRPSPTNLVAIDFDRDGDLDLVGVNYVGVRIAENDGSGVFTTGLRSLVTSDAAWIDCGDIDGDGWPDCVVAERSGNRLVKLLGDGSGGFRPPTYLRTGNGPSEVRLIDVDADGTLDLVVTEALDGTLSVRLNLGAGRFAVSVAYRASTGARGIAADDWNGDGRVDLACLGVDEERIFVFEGTGAGAFAPTAVLAAPSARYDIVSADFNLDGRPDLATTSNRGGSIAIYPSRVDGTFAPAQRFAAYLRPAGLTATDLNGDGQPDIVAGTDHFGRSVSVFINRCR